MYNDYKKINIVGKSQKYIHFNPKNHLKEFFSEVFELFCYCMLIVKSE